jgi:hypothetical protein
MGPNDAAERRVEIPSARHFGHVEVARLAGGSSAVVPPSIDVSPMQRPRGRCDFC